MKKLVLILSIVMTITGCYYDNGERSIFWDDEEKVTITREMFSEETDNWTVASCIALPDDWTTPITVTAKGSHQIEGQSVEFETVPAEYPDGVVEINTRYSIADYEWHCYTDVARDYVDSTDSGSIHYRFSPAVNTAIVFTTMGIISDERRNEYFYGNLASHQLLASDTYTSYWQKSEDELPVSGWEVMKNGTDTLIYEIMYGAEEINQMGSLFRFNESGLEQLNDAPLADSSSGENPMYMVNGFYISHHSYNADIGGNEQEWTDIRFSADLVTWSDPVTLPNIANIQWDSRSEKYMAFTNDYNTPTENSTYTSTDLINWTKEQWIDRQSPQVTFLNDGTAVIETSNPSDPYWIRDSVNDNWTSLAITPTDNPTLPGTILFNGFQLGNHHNRLFTSGLRRYLDDLGDSDPNTNTITNENVMFGYSDNGTDWTWSAIGLYDDVGLTLDLIFIDESTIIYSTSSALMISEDNGVTWQEKTQPTSLFNNDVESDVYNSAYITSIEKVNDEYIGVSSISSGSPLSNNILFKTQDFESYELLTVSTRIEPIQSLSQIHFLESKNDGINIQTLTEAAPDMDDDGISDAEDTDNDNDGVNDTDDAFPLDSTESIDTDGDSIGNNADTDDDNDDVLDADDAFPLDSTESIDTDGDSIGNNADTDDDNDDVLDTDDAFPLDDSESKDSDNDGTGDNADPTPNGIEQTNSSSSSGGSVNFGLLICLITLNRIRKRAKK